MIILVTGRKAADTTGTFQEPHCYVAGKVSQEWNLCQVNQLMYSGGREQMTVAEIKKRQLDARLYCYAGQTGHRT